MYPPVVLKSMPIPPLNPEKTGSPIAPSSMYTTITVVPSLPPNSPKVRKTAKVCRDIGTSPKGMEIHEQTAINAAIRPHKHMFFIEILLLSNQTTTFWIKVYHIASPLSTG